MVRPVAVVDEVTRLSRLPLWPGFDPLAYPLALCDGQRTWLFRHPDPPPDYQPAPEVPGAWLLPEAPFYAHSTAVIGGVRSATVLLDVGVNSLLDAAALCIHELFHVYQAARYPHWGADESHRFAYPAHDTEALTVRRLETEALRRALEASDHPDSARWAREASALRARRHELLPDGARAYEDGLEALEGLAFYVEHLARQDHAHRLPPEEFAPDAVRARCYLTGRAYAMLLDRHSPGWKERTFAHPAQLIAPAESVSFTEGELKSADAGARADVAALLARRSELRNRFLQQPGEVLEVVADHSPLRPRGFDPMNVHRLDGAELLHTRFLHAGSDGGRLDVSDRSVLTEGAGPHPLVHGFRRVIVTGLPPLEPAPTDDGGVRVVAPGLTLTFTKARAERCGSALLIRHEGR